VVDAYLKAKQSSWRPASLKVNTLYLTGDYFRPLQGIGIAEIAHATSPPGSPPPAMQEIVNR